MKTEIKNTINDIQETLRKIDNGIKFFFNIYFYADRGLIEKAGKDEDGFTLWVLTAKGKAMMTVQL